MKSSNQFAVDLYRMVREEEGNLFFSPLSISSALAMTFAGARGETEAEMARVLHFDMEQAQIHQAFEELQVGLRLFKRSGYELSIANRLWGDEGTEFLEPFLSITKDQYGATIGSLDFCRSPEKARQTINRWVSEQTRSKIRDLLPPGSIDDLARLILTNAVYFKGLWQEPFEKARTQEHPFTLIDGNVIQVPMMMQEDSFRYAEFEDLQILVLPYKQLHLSMVVLLPDAPGGLPELEEHLDLQDLQKRVSEARHEVVEVYLPKFTFSSAFSLAPVLSRMGMPSAFAPGKADFSGMNGERDLFLSGAVHQAFVEVNEKGTEAAAATGTIMTAMAGPPVKPRIFRADHSFLFLIRDNETGSYLFMGRVMDPTS